MTRQLWIALGALGALSLPAAAQDDRPVWRTQPWKFDEYTRNDPEAIAHAGYESYGPFVFGQRGSKVVTTQDIEAHLSYAQIRWVETEHFRIGSELPMYVIPQEMKTRRKIRAELERLKKKIPTVNPRTRRLDPWLRVHLTAQRLEDLYAEFQDWAGVEDSDFPSSPEDVVRTKDARYMGYGPYLGMKDKYIVLILEDAGTYNDYLKNFVGRNSKFTQRWHFKDIGSMFVGTSLDSNEGRFKHDTALHCHLVFNVTINLLDGFRHFSYHLPVWIREGLGHWFGRNVDPRWNSFDQDEGSPLDMRSTWKWHLEARKLVNNEDYTPFSKAYTWRSYGQIGFDDHVALWSRVDFLLSKGKEPWREFLFAIKGRVDENWRPDSSDLVGAVRQALRDAYGLNPLNIDERWGKWVLETYPTR